MLDKTTPERPTSSRKRSNPSDDRSTVELSNIACQRCRSRKTKCDGGFPSCSCCNKAEVPCIIADPTASRPYTRQEVRDLEDKARRLQSLFSEQRPSSDEVIDSLRGLNSNTPTAANGRQPRLRRNGLGTRYVGTEDESIFSRYISHAIRKHCSPSTLKTLFAPNVSAHYIEHHLPHNLPPRDQATDIFTNYLNDFHLDSPFLDTSKIWATIERFCQDSLETSISPEPLSPAQRQEVFQLNMALALGSVRPFRLGNLHLHPFGFFTAALQVLSPSGFSFSSLEDIENFLLIGNFGLYYHIGCSIWELSQLCIRMCIEQGLHKKSSDVTEGDNLREERRNRIFWVCYRLDRVSSSTLGRPFGVDDSDIEIEPTVNQSSNIQVSPHHGVGLLQPAATGYFPDPESNLAVFSHSLQLCRITSQVHEDLYFKHVKSVTNLNGLQAGATGRESDSHLKPGEIYTLFSTFDHQLDHWRNTAPTNTRPTSVYKMTEYLDLCYHKERLFLLRMVMDRTPSDDNAPSDVLLRLCTDSAASIVQNYEYLRQHNYVTYTRSFTRLIFSAGLVLVYAAFSRLVKQSESRATPSLVDVATWWRPVSTRPPSSLTYEQVLTVLSAASDLLFWFADQMPDMLVFAHFFEALQRDLPPGPRHIDPTTTEGRHDIAGGVNWAAGPSHSQASHPRGVLTGTTAPGLSEGLEVAVSQEIGFNSVVSAHKDQRVQWVSAGIRGSTRTSPIYLRVTSLDLIWTILFPFCPHPGHSSTTFLAWTKLRPHCPAMSGRQLYPGTVPSMIKHKDVKSCRSS